MNQEISLVIKIEVQEGKRQEQINAFNTLAPIVRAELGCIQYELKAVEDNENQFVLLEKWASMAALDAHDKTAHMIEADSKNHLFRAKPAEVLKLVDL